MRHLPATALTVSALALGGIALHEGYRGEAYSDAAGLATIGYGATAGVQPGDRTDPVRAVLRLAADADRAARQIAQCIGPVPLYQHEFDAYVSLAYNIGSGAFCRSTLVERLQQTPPDYAGACREILRWVYAGGRRLAGLERRRRAEYQQCINHPLEGRS